jgi:hypothetical protein
MGSLAALVTTPIYQSVIVPGNQTEVFGSVQMKGGLLTLPPVVRFPNFLSGDPDFFT